MKRYLPVVVIAAALLLTGCTATVSDPADVVTPTTETTEAPLTAETSAPEVDDAYAVFLAEVRAALPANTQIPDATDEQLLTAGQKGCDLLAEGTNPDDVSVIEGEQRSELGYYNDSIAIVTAATAYLCS